MIFQPFVNLMYIVYTIKFPKDGEIPKIIAVDQNENWMDEREGVPDSWLE